MKFMLFLIGILEIGMLMFTHDFYVHNFDLLFKFSAAISVMLFMLIMLGIYELKREGSE